MINKKITLALKGILDVRMHCDEDGVGVFSSLKIRKKYD